MAPRRDHQSRFFVDDGVQDAAADDTDFAPQTVGVHYDPFGGVDAFKIVNATETVGSDVEEMLRPALETGDQILRS